MRVTLSADAKSIFIVRIPTLKCSIQYHSHHMPITADQLFELMQHNVHIKKMSKAWKDPRREKCLCSGSNWADALASLGYNSRYAYAERLLGKRKDVEMNDRMQFGCDQEAWVAESYAEMHGVVIEPAPFEVYEEEPRFGASGDYIATDPRNGERIAVEIKTTEKSIGTVGWVPPVNHLLQMLAQLKCFKLRRAHYVVYNWRDEEFRMMEITFDDELFDQILWPRTKAWIEMIARGQLPPRKVSSQLKISISNAVYDHVHITPVDFSRD